MMAVYYGCAVLLGILGLVIAKPLPRLDTFIISDANKSLEEDHDTASAPVAAGPFAEDCESYCSLTYSEHTYSEPDNFLACTTGCRTAQLEAFIAWPLKSDIKSCESSCQGVYSTDKDHLFACSTGCHTPTLDSTLPDRSHLYLEEEANDTASDNLDNVLSSFLSTIFQNMFSFNEAFSFDDLSDHSEKMNTIMIPYRRADVTILTPDGIYSYSQFSFEDSSDQAWNSENKPPSVPSISRLVDHHDTTHTHVGGYGCVWRRHRAVLSRVVLVFAMGLVVLSAITCFLSLCSDTKKVKVPLKVSALKATPPVLLTKKAPYQVGSEFILPPKVGGNMVAKISLM